jgi:hypothetical protein
MQFFFNWMGYTVLNSRMVLNDELEITWKKTVLPCLQVLFQHFQGRAEENHNKIQDSFRKIMTNFNIALSASGSKMEP